MKTYTLDEIIENYRADIDEFVNDEWVPADVARRIYDSLQNMAAMVDKKSSTTDAQLCYSTERMIREEAGIALAAADGEG